MKFFLSAALLSLTASAQDVNVNPGNNNNSSDVDPSDFVGGDRDANDCIPSAGYSWCPASQECLRPWETACDTILLGDGDDDSDRLLSGWTLFDPEGRAELKTTGDCTPTTGGYIHTTLDYVTGVNIECDDDSGECTPFIPPAPNYNGSDKWLVTNFVLAKQSKECPIEGGPLKKSFGVQFYTKNDKGSRSMTSQPSFFGRMDEKRGKVTVTTIDGDDDGMYYATCVKVPISCQNPNPSFEGWTGISYQNRPLVPEDCEGPIELYIDSIKISNMCPFEVPDEEDLGDNFCIDRGSDGEGDGDRYLQEDDVYRGACKPETASNEIDGPEEEEKSVGAQSTSGGRDRGATGIMSYLLLAGVVIVGLSIH